MTFAAITPALIIGGFAERIKFSAVLLFSLLWGTFVYLPIAHMVWYAEAFSSSWGRSTFAGGRWFTSTPASRRWSALCARSAHRLRPRGAAAASLVMTLIGGSLLWVGWFGFNAGSNLEANGGTTLAIMNTFVATAGATLAWLLAELEARERLRSSASSRARWRPRGGDAGPAAMVGPMGAIVLGALGRPRLLFLLHHREERPRL
jgi:Amt family ammonium transporter